MTSAALSRPPSGTGETRWAQFIELDEDDLRELINGRLVEVEVPTEIHEWIVSMLCHFLMKWALERRAGRVLVSGYKVKISDERGVMPDLQFYRRGNSADRRPTGLEGGHPDLVVEVVSESSRRYDRVIKLGWYASIEVPEYWIVDPTSRTLERLVLHDGHYVIAQALADQAEFQPPTFDGLSIPLAMLWAPDPELF